LVVEVVVVSLVFEFVVGFEVVVEDVVLVCGYAKIFSRSHDAVIRVYDDARNVIETHEHTGDFKGLVTE
jgi:hypothetical protein